MSDEKQKLCLECLECCKIILVRLNMKEAQYYFTPSAMAFWEMRDCKPWIDDTGQPWLVVPKTCQHLNVLTGCMIYEDRSDECRNYDGLKDPWIRKVCKWNELDG